MCPADHFETIKAIEAAINHEGPVYVRLGRLAVPYLFDENYKFEIGKSSTLKDGDDITVIATGLMVGKALEAYEVLKSEGINVRVINMPSIKPIDEEAIIKAAKETKGIITVEEHSVIGGLGSAVCDVLCTKYPAKVDKIGVQDRFGQSGKPDELLEEYGLTAENIVKHVKKMLNK